MKITALTAVNLESKYLSCVPFFIDFWLGIAHEGKSVDYVPKVLVIAARLPLELEDYKEWCELFDVETGVSSVFTSQVVRVLYPSLEDSDYVITTDVDMLPIGDRVFQKGLEQIEKGAEFVVCRDVLPKGQYPICYNLASPQVWKRVNRIGSEINLRSELAELFKGVREEGNYLGKRGGAGWFSDQELLYSFIQRFESEGGRTAKLLDQQTRHRRLDRLFMPFPISWLFLTALAGGFFTDYHVHHPVKRYKRYLKAISLLQKFRTRKNRF
jgi:hypothetical protein